MITTYFSTLQGFKFEKTSYWINLMLSMLIMIWLKSKQQVAPKSLQLSRCRGYVNSTQKCKITWEGDQSSNRNERSLSAADSSRYTNSARNSPRSYSGDYTNFLMKALPRVRRILKILLFFFFGIFKNNFLINIIKI